MRYLCIVSRSRLRPTPRGGFRGVDWVAEQPPVPLLEKKRKKMTTVVIMAEYLKTNSLYRYFTVVSTLWQCLLVFLVKGL